MQGHAILSGQVGWLNEGSDGLPPSSCAFQASLSLASADQ